MEKLYIIGNLTRDPETRIVNTTEGAVTVCSFDVAVNDRNKEKGAKYFHVSAWRKLGDICGKYLRKGAKVAVCGVVTAGAYIPQAPTTAQQQFTAVESDELPF